jgi:hypothetical protein
MPFRLYIVPVIGTGAKFDPRRAKYFADGTVSPTAIWSSIDYGFEPWMIVGGDLSTSDDNLVVGKVDAFALPFDLSPTLTAGQVTNVQTKLESINVPAGWVNTSLTWLTVVRTTLGMFSFLQRYGVIYTEANGVVAPSLFTGGVTLSTTFGSLPQAVQNAIISAAQSFNISTAGLTASTTMRVILKALADNFQASQYSFNGTMI